MYKIIASSFLIITLSAGISHAQDKNLTAQIKEIAPAAKGIVGVSILGIESGDTLNYNGNARLVMHSVMKFPIAMAVLHLVDSGIFTLDKTIHIKKRDLPK